MIGSCSVTWTTATKKLSQLQSPVKFAGDLIESEWEMLRFCRSVGFGLDLALDMKAPPGEWLQHSLAELKTRATFEIHQIHFSLTCFVLTKHIFF